MQNVSYGISIRRCWALELIRIDYPRFPVHKESKPSPGIWSSVVGDEVHITLGYVSPLFFKVLMLSLWNAGCGASKRRSAGARSGCSISASRKCKPPWWKGLFVAAPTDYEERERCEEREMAACLEAAKEACIKFAKAKCIGPFRDARIASEGLVENTDFHVWGAAADKSSSTSACALNNQQSFSPDPGATNYRGSDVLDSLSSKENNSSG
ncbi:hypothetical protein SORBI_3005G188300 [Sorghum bicolor]|uniref:Uncharacterized protein n=1 Tax=Sorghum bicolor TaxID=4558 RepID=A0A1Z5RJE2_SORBI|nr:hypothetical protein SORBI_3005G188300 [Sorghum bicolor]OQU83849.1 hypothetical protein SORBI_3005G188300 [Sorghum bicolor]